MTKQIAWDQYEAAILLEAYIKVYEGLLDRNKAIQYVSDKLRKRAMEAGYLIDDTFRNEAGIKFQMYSMESAFLGHTILKPATKLFAEVVELRKNNRIRYDQILLGEKEMIPAKKPLEEKFCSWLAKRISPSQVPEYLSVLLPIEEFCIDNKIIKNPLFEAITLEELAKVQDTVERNKEFRYQYKRQTGRMTMAIRYFIEFINEEKDQITVQSTFSFDRQSKKVIDNTSIRRSSTTEEDIPEGAILTLTNKGQLQQEKLAFMSWMQHQGLAENSLRPYVSMVNRCSEYAQENGHLDRSLFMIINADEVGLLIKLLLQDPDFVKWNKQHSNRYKAALEKYLLFRKDINFIESISTASVYESPIDKYDEELLNKCKSVLNAKFEKGYRIDSNIDLRKFKKAFETIVGEPIVQDAPSIQNIIRHCGIEYQGKLYLPEKMLSTEKKEKLLSYIDNLFSSGKEMIYYSAILSELTELFDGERIYTAEMLKVYLENTANNKYFFDRNYMSVDRNIKTEPIDEIRNYLINRGEAVETEEIFAALGHIPDGIITQTLRRYGEFARNSKGVYFHTDLIALSDDQLNKIGNIIQDDINRWGYAIGTEIINSVRAKYPNILEPYNHFSELGLRNAISYKLKDRFSFNSNVISEFGKKLSMTDVYSNFSRQHKHFTLAELETLKNQTGSGIIYLAAVYDNALRISEKEFVSLENANFDIAQTDAAISRYLSSDYIPISDIRQFGTFPYAGYPWNCYLLESYVLHFSKSYKLINNVFNAYTCVGAIVKRASNINNFHELLVQVLANSSCELYPEPALNYLFDKGYIGRRVNKEIEKILADAKAQRSMKGL